MMFCWFPCFQCDVNTEHSDFGRGLLAVSCTWRLGELHRWRSYVTKLLVYVTGCCYKQYNTCPSWFCQRWMTWRSVNLLSVVMETVMKSNSTTCSTGELVHNNQYETSENIQYCNLATVALCSYNLCRWWTLTIRSVRIRICVCVC